MNNKFMICHTASYFFVYFVSSLRIRVFIQECSLYFLSRLLIYREKLLFMSRFFKQIKTIIPVKVYIGDVKFNTFVQYYNTNKGKYLEMVNTMRSTKNTPNFNFNKFKTFTEKYKLTYLTDQYIKQVKVKSIMYK